MPALIGITTSRIKNKSQVYLNEVSEAYTSAVIRAGGMPVLIPSDLPAEQASALLARLDGILLTGGSDIDPRVFGGKQHERVYGVDHKRDAIELELVRQAVESGRPFLGICRGIQVINVALGGSLFTHIGDQLPGALQHDWDGAAVGRDYLAHQVTVKPDNRLHHIVKTTALSTNSFHHQGIERLAPGLICTAHTADSLIEAVELPDHPFGLGVQWHPECLPALDEHQALFRALVQAAEGASTR